jgi:hypothetical protein
MAGKARPCGFGIFPSPHLYNPWLSDAEKVLLMMMADYADINGWCCLSIPTMASAMGKSDRVVQKRIEKLIRHHAVMRETRYVIKDGMKRRQKSNGWVILWPLTKIVETKEKPANMTPPEPKTVRPRNRPACPGEPTVGDVIEGRRAHVTRDMGVSPSDADECHPVSPLNKTIVSTTSLSKSAPSRAGASATLGEVVGDAVSRASQGREPLRRTTSNPIAQQGGSIDRHAGLIGIERDLSMQLEAAKQRGDRDTVSKILDSIIATAATPSNDATWPLRHRSDQDSEGAHWDPSTSRGHENQGVSQPAIVPEQEPLLYNLS